MVTACTVSNDFSRSKNVEENNTRKTKKKGRNLSSFLDCLRRRPGFVLLLLPAALLASFYAVSSEEDYDFDPRYLYNNNDDDDDDNNEARLDAQGKKYKCQPIRRKGKKLFSFFLSSLHQRRWTGI